MENSRTLRVSISSLTFSDFGLCRNSGQFFDKAVWESIGAFIQCGNGNQVHIILMNKLYIRILGEQRYS